MDVYYLCGGRKCCPMLKKDGKYWKIEDDYGGSVRLTKKQLITLSDVVSTM